MPADEETSSNVTKSVVVLDLARYSDSARHLQQQLSANAVDMLNQQIQSFVLGSLERINIGSEEALLETTGDGAVLAFDAAEQAFAFSEALHTLVHEHNLGKDVELAQRHFRVGVSTGEMCLERRVATDGELKGYRIAGLPVINATRLESACKTGQVLVDESTWRLLPRPTQKRFGPRETVEGKRDEAFPAYRCQIVAPAAWEETKPEVPAPQVTPEPAVRATRGRGTERLTPEELRAEAIVVEAQPATLILDMSREDSDLKVCLYREGEERRTVIQEERVPWDEAAVRERCFEISGAFALCVRGESGAAAERLRKAGKDLYDALLTDDIKGRLREASEDHLILRLEDALVGIPWELLFDGESFLSIRFATGRLVKSREKPQTPDSQLGEPVRFAILSDPKGNLPAARAEGDALSAQTRLDTNIAVDARTEVTVEQVLHALRTSDLVHYCGHAEYNDQEPSASGWLLADGTLSGTTIINLLAAEKRSPELVFSNACHSGRAEEWGNLKQDGLYGIARSFLLAGVKHYIGTFWEVLDDHCRRFAAYFYESLQTGETIGIAIRNARRNIIESYGEGCLVWASYLLYGNPAVRILEGREEAKTTAPGPDSVRSGPPFSPDVGGVEPKKRILALPITGLFMAVLLIAVIILVWRSASHGPPAPPVVPPEPGNVAATFEYLRQRTQNSEYRKSIPDDRWTSRLMTIAVFPIETGGDLEMDSRECVALRAMLESFFTKQAGLDIVGRDKMDKVLEEQKIGSSELADPRVRTRLGEILAARLLFAGQLYREADALDLAYYLVDTESTAKVSPDWVSGATRVESLAGLVATDLLTEIRGNYPLRGYVVDVENDDVLLNIGEAVGVLEGQRFTVIAEPSSQQSRLKSLSTAIAELSIAQTDEDLSLARVVKKEREIRPDMKVEISEWSPDVSNESDSLMNAGLLSNP